MTDKRREWEYRQETAPAGNRIEERARFFETLQELGGEGWELVAFHEDHAYFKRERPQDS